MSDTKRRKKCHRETFYRDLARRTDKRARNSRKLREREIRNAARSLERSRQDHAALSDCEAEQA